MKLYQALILTGVFLLITAAIGVYDRDAVQDFRVFTKRFVLASQFLYIPAVAFFAVTKAAAGLPFGWFIGILTIAIMLFMAVVLVARLIVLWTFRKSIFKKRILVLGHSKSAQAATDFILGAGRSHLQHVQSIAISRVVRNRTVPYTEGSLATAVDYDVATPILLIAKSLRIDEIVVAVDDKRGLPMQELLECKLRGIEVTDYLSFWERETGQIDFTHAGPGWLTFSQGFLTNRPRRAIKRIVDFAVSLILLTLVLPLVIIVAVAIKLESRGPVFYRQERVGLNGNIFKVFKFRSMRTDAEKDGVPRWASASDDRVTRIGHFIRKVRIDEIPQIINVLAGDMSFTGPRPERAFFVEQLRKEIPFYDLRHRVKPGITGWAQVNYPYGASIEDAKRKLAYDLYYVKNNDVYLDFAVLVQTVRVILFAHGGR